ncbi:putative PHD type zinc finger protein with BAH domain-containing protein [Irineochytrium annulatum]|nr:putative PHD type zinc finger protein with BAH domain-containing protein [Irineochytrium annulatum]
MVLIRGKCRITHTHFIKNLDAYRDMEDSFYYNQLYDRYTKNLYDVIPLTLVKNLPAAVLDSLKNYTFIVVEEGKASDFTDRIVCPLCSKWCQYSDAVNCCQCGKDYHLNCVGLVRRPPKGYAWKCLYCVQPAMAVEEGVAAKEAESQAVEPPSSEEKNDAMEIDAPATKNLWPFRYFGDYFNMNDLNDPLESGIGKQYQADVPDSPDTLYGADMSGNAEEYIQVEVPEDRTGKVGRPRKRKLPTSTMVKVEKRSSEKERVFDLPHSVEESQVDEFFSKVKEQFGREPTIDVSDIIISTLHAENYDFGEALAAVSKRGLQDVFDDWEESEIQAFEAGIEKFGHDLHLIQKEVPTKNMRSVVRYFYKWKKTERYLAVYSKFCKKYRPGKVFKNWKTGEKIPLSTLSEEGEDDEDDDLGTGSKGKHGDSHECSNCGASSSPSWLLRQEGARLDCFCKDCGAFWLRYGGSRFVSESLRKANREIAGAKRKGVAEDSDKKIMKKRGRKPGKKKESIPDIKGFVEDFTPVEPCAVCFDWNQENLQVCHNCGLKVHQGCYGIRSADPDRFICSRCQNERDEDAMITYECVLCPNTESSRDGALSKTIGRNWAHIACCIWIPEVRFGHAEAMSPVECLGFVDRRRWTATCDICRLARGAVLFCSERGCYTKFHVTCGQRAGFDFLIEEGKSSRHPGLTSSAYCDLHRRVSSASKNGAASAIESTRSRSEMIAEFVRTCKQTPVSLDTAGQRRAYSMVLEARCACHGKAEADEQVPAVENGVNSATSCAVCAVEYSPYWWPGSELPEEKKVDDGVVCNICYHSLVQGIS